MGTERRWRKQGLLLAGWAFAQAATAIETGEIRLEEGFVEPRSGVRIEKIVDDAATGMQEIHLAVPRAAVPDEAVDEVVVTAERPRRITLPQLKPHRFVADYAHDYYGLVVFLGKHESMPLRFYLDARQDAPGVPPP